MTDITLETDLSGMLADLHDVARGEVIETLTGLTFYAKVRDVIPDLQRQAKDARAAVKNCETVIRDTQGAIAGAQVELDKVLKEFDDVFQNCEHGQLHPLAYAKDSEYQFACASRERAQNKLRRARETLAHQERDLAGAQALVQLIDGFLRILQELERPALPTWLARAA